MNYKKKYQDITGQRFGRLTALRYVGANSSGNARWLVRCDCGVEFEVAACFLRMGRVRSCGCIRRERMIEYNKTRNAKNMSDGNDKRN